MFKAPVIFEPTDKRIRLKLGEHFVADSGRAMLLIPPGQFPVYVLPIEDFADGALTALGGAAQPFDGAVHGLDAWEGHVTVAWDAVRWFEEEQEILRHPRNPFVRVDCIASTRKVQVSLGGAVVAESRRAVFLFETGYITRHYMPIEDVRPGLLRPSDHTSYCPYKGHARYYSIELGGRAYDNVVWFYPEPYDECAKVKGLVAFWNEKMDAVTVDGAPESRRFIPRI